MNDYIALQAIVQQLLGINKGSVPINITLTHFICTPGWMGKNEYGRVEIWRTGCGRVKK